MKKSMLWTACKYGLGLVLLALVVWRFWEPRVEDGQYIPGLKDALEKPVHYTPLLLATIICFLSLLLTFVRWYLLVRAQDMPFTLWNALRLGWIGFALSTFLPGSVGGDIIKAAVLAHGRSRRTVAVATVVFDRIIGLCGLFWLVALLGGFFWCTGMLEQLATTPGAQDVLIWIFVAALALGAGSFVFWWTLGLVPLAQIEPLAQRISQVPKIGHSLAEVWRALLLYHSRGHSIRLSVLLALIGHIGFILTFYYSALTLCSPEEIPSLGSHFLVVPVGMTIQAGVPTPGGVGGGEVAFGWLYSLLQFAFATGVLASLVQRVITWGLGLVGYIAYLWMKPSLDEAAQEITDASPGSAGAQAEASELSTLHPEIDPADLRA